MTRLRGLPRHRSIPLAVLVLVYGIVMNRTVFGRHIYAIGGNRHAAELSGIKTRRVDFWLFVNMGVLAALVERLLGRLHWDGVPVRGMVAVGLALAFWIWRRQRAKYEMPD